MPKTESENPPRRTAALLSALAVTAAVASHAHALAGAIERSSNAHTAQANQSPADDEPAPARPQLITETRGLIPNTTNFIALTFEIDEGWHVYWPGQNDTGFAPSIELTLPEGWTAGETQWPAPHRHIAPGNILDHIYENGQATFIIPITIPQSAQPGPATISADLEWLVCREACIPGWQTVTLETTLLQPNARPQPSQDAAKFKAARARFAEPFPPPPPLPGAPPVLRKPPAISMKWQGDALIISAVPVPTGQPSQTDAGSPSPVALAFYPSSDSAPISDLLTAGQSAAKPASSSNAPPPPLRLLREDDAKPIRGIVEVTFSDPKAPPALYKIDSAPAEDRVPTESSPD